MFVGNDSFTYQVSDGLAQSAAVTVKLEITNQAPLAVRDSYKLRPGETLSITDPLEGILGNDADGDVLQATIVTQPTSGTLTLQADGTFEYTPDADFTSGTDSFTYTAGDGIAESGPVIVTIDLESSPAAVVDDSYHIGHNEPLAVNANGGVLANDLDWDGDSLSTSLVSGPAHGTLLFNSDGSFTYTPEAGFVGSDSFAYLANDTFTDSGPATVSIEVTNSPPTAHDDLFSIRRNVPLEFSADELLGNDFDADGDALALIVVDQPANGTLIGHGDGTFTYTPSVDYAGSDSFTYRLTDSLDDSETVTVSIEVGNTAPTAAPDVFEIAHDRQLNAVAGALFINDFDLEADHLTAILHGSGPSHGTLVLGSDGAFTYTPEAGYVGQDLFEYVVSDGDAQSEPVRVSIDIHNSRPTLVGRTHRTAHDMPLTVAADEGLLAGASDADEDPLTLTIVTGPSHGTLVHNADGSFTYTPEAGYVGGDAVAYRVGDSIDDSQTALLKIDVTNIAPTAVTDVYMLNRDQILNVSGTGVLENDLDVDGDAFQLSLLDDVERGTLALDADGSFSYTPAGGFAGFDRFTYEISDGLQTSLGTVYLEVVGDDATGDVAPRAGNDRYELLHGGVLEVDAAGGVLSNDIVSAGEGPSVSLVSGPDSGTLVLHDDGSFEFTPASATFVGTVNFTYEVDDGTGGSDTATATITVTNEIPWAEHAVYDVHHGDELGFAEPGLILSAGDADGDELTFQLLTNPNHGTLDFNSDGTFSYTPDTGFSGNDNFTWRVKDGIATSNTASVVIDVTNTRPTGLDANYSVGHDQVLTVDDPGLLSTVVDADGDLLTVQFEAGPAHGTLQLAADGSFTYTPHMGYAGSDSFTYSVHDGAEASLPVTVTIDVSNSEPELFAAERTIKHGTPVTLDPGAFDADGDTVTYEIVAGPTHGSLTYEQLIDSGYGGEPVRFRGAITYTPNVGYVGTDTLVIIASDEVDSSEATTLTFNVTNIAPTASDAIYQTAAGAPLTVEGPGLFRTVFDGDGDHLNIELVSQPSNGSVFLLTDGGLHTGGFRYTPHAGFSGSDLFTYTVSDGAETSDVYTITLNVTNIAPQAIDQRFSFHTTDYGVSGLYELNLSDNKAAAVDADADPLSFSQVSDPQHGTVTLYGSGFVRYTPDDPSFVGSDTFQYRVNDGYSASELATVTITLTNSPAQAADDLFSINQNELLTFALSDLLGNDVDFDGDLLQLVEIDDPAVGSLSYNTSTQEYTFDPDGYVGTAKFTYTISDGIEVSDPATIEIEVTNEAPWAVDTFIAGEEGNSFSGDLLDGTSHWNLDDDDLIIELVEDVQHGALTLNDPQSGGNGSYNYVPQSDFGGSDSFTYTISDGITTSAPITVSIQVQDTLTADALAAGGDGGQFTIGSDDSPGFLDYTPPATSGVNIPPVAVADDYQVLHGQTLTIGKSILLLNDLGFGETLTVSDIQNGSATITELSNGSLVFEAPNGSSAVGVYDFQYRVSDGTRQSDWVTVTIEVTNERPEAKDVLHYVRTNTGDNDEFLLMMDLAMDGDDDPLNINIESGPTNGTATVDYSWVTYIPDVGFQGTDSFDFTASDGAESTDTTTVTIIVNDDISVYTDQLPPRAAVYPDDDEFQWNGGTLTGSVRSNDNWQTGEDWTLVGTSSASIGSATVNADGTFSYTLDPGSVESFISEEGAEFTYTIEDSQGITRTATVTILPNLLEPGEKASHDFQVDVDGVLQTHMAVVSNGSTGSYDGNNVALGDVYVWFEDDLAHVAQVEDGGSYRISVDDGDPSYPDVPIDVDWQGTADALSLTTSGNVTDSPGGSPASISANGYLYLSVGGSVGDVSAQVIDVTAGGTLGNVNADDLVVNATAGTAIGDVTAGSHVLHVSVGQGAAPLYEPVEANVSTVTATNGFVGSVYATQDVGDVTAALGIGKVTAGNDITGEISASNGSIGLGAGWSGGGYYAGPDAHFLTGGVSAGNNIIGSVSATGGSIGYVYAGQSIQGNVTADQHIAYVRADAGAVSGNVAASGGNVVSVRAGTNVAGTVAADNIGEVSAGGDVEGDISANGTIGSVSAGGDISGNISASGGSIFAIHAGAGATETTGGGSITAGNISAAESIGSISAGKGESGGDISAGDIRAESGSIRGISAGGSIDTTISAGNSIGNVSAATGIAGSITAEGGFVGQITVSEGSLNATVNAVTHIKGVSARDNISQTIDSGGGIGNVTATTGSISGDLLAGSSIGNVTAGTDIEGSITATSGHIGKIEAGSDSVGNISGDISAGGNIAGVAAIVSDESVITPGQQVPDSNYQTELADWLNQADPDIDNIPTPPRPDAPPSVGGGDISGTIEAAGSIGSVIAVGGISQDITAGDHLNVVWALGDIDAAIQSSAGSLAINSWGAVTGQVTANGHVEASAYDDFGADVTTSAGTLELSTWGALTSSTLQAPEGVFVFVHGETSGTSITSSDGRIGLVSYGDANATLDSAQTAAVSVLGRYDGQIISRQGDVIASAAKGIDAQITAQTEAIASSLGSVRGSIDAKAATVAGESLAADLTTSESISLTIHQDVSGDIRSTAGSIVIDAGQISGSVTADQGAVGIVTYGYGSGQNATSGDVAGAVNGYETVVISAAGDVAQAVSSSTGSVLVMADGVVSGAITAQKDISVVAWGEGESVAESLQASEGSITVFAFGSVAGEVDAGGDINLSTWGSVNGDVTAGGSVEIFARQDVQNSVTADGSATVTAGGDVLGDVTAGQGQAGGDHQATVVTNGSIEGDVTAAGDATLDAFGDVQSTVTTTSGDVTVSTLGSYAGSVTAGGGAGITVGGSLDNNQIDAAGSVNVSAHGAISNLSVNAGGDIAVLGDGQVSNATLTGTGNTGSVTLGSLEALQNVTITTVDDASLFAGDASTADVTTTSGDIDFTALGNIGGTYRAGNGVSIVAYGDAADLTVTAGAGDAFVFADGNVSATQLTAGGSLSVTALGNIDATGTTSAGDAATLTALGTLNANVSAGGDVAARSGGTLQGSLTSGRAGVYAVATGADGSADVSATVSGRTDATVSAFAGSVSGSVTATTGDAAITAAADISGEVSVGGNAGLFAIGEVSGGITAGGSAAVNAFGDVSGPVTAAGFASVTSGGNISGTVSGASGAAAIARGGDVSSDVSSASGNVVAVATGNVGGNADAGRHASVIALGDVSGTIDAGGHASLASLGGSVSSSVSAGQSASVFALSDVNLGSASAGKDFVVSTLGAYSGSLTAGRNALVTTADSAGGSVTGGIDATVIAFGQITASVTGTSGDAFVIAGDGVTSTVTAGNDAFVIASGGSSNVNLTAGRDALLQSFGSTTAIVSAGRDSSLWSREMLAGSVSAGGNAAALSMAQSTIAVDAGGDAFLFAVDGHQGIVTAGGNAFLQSLGRVQSSVSGGGDAGVYAVGDVVSTNVDAGGFASLVSWGNAQPLITVDGVEGASVWTYGDLNAQVTSTAGFAVVSTLGNATRTNVTAETDAVVFAAGNFNGQVTAGGSAQATALGDLSGTLTAGETGALLSEGNINATSSAGKDLILLAYGDITGSHTAGRDASAYTYGNFNAGLAAGRDIAGVTAVGDLAGTVTAERHVEVVFAYGDINAALFARNTADSADGGAISSVQALGHIDGTIAAQTRVGSVVAGGSITATLMAPEIGAVTGNDVSLPLNNPLPEAPASIRDALLAEAEAAHDAVFADVATLMDDLEQVSNELAASRREAANEIAAERAEAQAAVAQTRADAADALADSRSAAVQQLAQVAESARRADDSIRAMARNERSELTTARDNEIAAQNKAYADTQTRVEQMEEAIVKIDAAMALVPDDIAADAASDRNRREAGWVDGQRQFVKSSLQQALSPPDPPKPEDIVQTAGDGPWHARSKYAMDELYHELGMIRERGEYIAQRDAETQWALERLAGLAEVLPGFGAGVAAHKLFAGTDLLGQEISGVERFFAGVEVFGAVAGFGQITWPAAPPTSPPPPASAADWLTTLPTRAE